MSLDQIKNKLLKDKEKKEIKKLERVLRLKEEINRIDDGLKGLEELSKEDKQEIQSKIKEIKEEFDLSVRTIKNKSDLLDHRIDEEIRQVKNRIKNSNHRLEVELTNKASNDEVSRYVENINLSLDNVNKELDQLYKDGERLKNRIVRLSAKANLKTVTQEDLTKLRKELIDLMDRVKHGIGGGPSDFYKMADTPDSYVSQQDKLVTVKDDESGLEFRNYIENLNKLGLNTGYTPTGSETVGTSYWDSDNKTVSTVLENGVIGQQFKEVFFDIQNDTGDTLENGKVIAYEGSIGNSGNVRGEYGIADGSIVSGYNLGISTEDIADGEVGQVTFFGKVRGIQTNGANYSETWNDGDVVWVSPTIAGGLTNVEPNAPNQSIIMGIVVSAHPSNGTLLVRPRYPAKMTELSDVNGTPLDTNGQVIVWDNINNYFDFNSSFFAEPTGKVYIKKSQVGTADFLELINNGAFANGGVSIVGKQGAGNFDMFKLDVQPGTSYLNTKLEEHTANSSKALTLRRDIDVSGNHRFGDIAGGNYTKIESDGTVNYIGDATVFEDLNFDPTRSGGPVATRPNSVVINNVFHNEFDSGNNQTCGAVEELPHNYKLSSLLYPHVHLFLKSGESAGTTGVTFTLYWELRQSTGTTSGSVTLSATSAELGTTAGGNKLTIYNGSFAGSAELGAQLALTIARTAGNAGDIVVTTYGVHYEIDTPGSRTQTSK